MLFTDGKCLDFCDELCSNFYERLKEVREYHRKFPDDDLTEASCTWASGHGRTCNPMALQLGHVNAFAPAALPCTC